MKRKKKKPTLIYLYSQTAARNCGLWICKSSMDMASLHRLLMLGDVFLSENNFNSECPVMSLFRISTEVIRYLYTEGITDPLMRLFFLICASGARIAHLSFSPL